MGLNFKHSKTKRLGTTLPTFVQFHIAFLLLITTFTLSWCSTIRIPRQNFEIPGEPLNPDDFSAATHHEEDVEAGLIEPDVGSQPGEPEVETLFRIKGRDLPRKWSTCRVPYEISQGFSSGDRSTIMASVKAFKFPGAVVFSPKMSSDKNYLTFQSVSDDTGCTSVVGMQGGQQMTTMAPSCTHQGSIMHEMMHVLGFDHEHERPDRDKYVTIQTEYINPAYVTQFDKFEKCRNTVTPYDLGSILHYSKYADCKEPCDDPTILPIDSSYESEIGQREKLSKYDKQKVTKTYKCTPTSNTRLIEDSLPFSSASINQTQDCQDFDERCNYLDVDKDCNGTQTWVNFNCQKTCNTCSEGSNSNGCRDFNLKCGAWSEENYCSNFPEYMHVYCRESCGLCG